MKAKLMSEKKFNVLTPKTAFPLKPEPSIEQNYVESWTDAYKLMQNANSTAKVFTLHDGPPYANGHIHIGHALNKILKDITNRFQFANGKKLNYVPGWDCHGLPIEWKVEEIYRKQNLSKDENPTKFRDDCRSYAQDWINIQRDEFKRLGILADWDTPYTTMAFENEAAIVQNLYNFLMADLIVRKNKPVMWSPVEKTALAEAEVEYKDVACKSIYVGFPIEYASDELSGAELLVWTTTPWTLPGNEAIAFNPELEYVLVTAGPKKLVMSADLVNQCSDHIKTPLQVLNKVSVDTLLAIKVRDPLFEKWRKLYPADFVNSDQGTGFVHIAPGHGLDDFLLGVEYELDTTSIIDDTGCIAPSFGELSGVHVYKADAAVCDILTKLNATYYEYSFIHSYPHSWRSKKPVIYKTTPQWFIDIGKTKARSLAEIDNVNWYPKTGRNRLYSMVESRDEWCISRQRYWGVPIALFVHRKTGELLRDIEVNERVIKEFAEHGCNVWYDQPVEYFIKDWDVSKEYQKVTDVLDVWFDSGCSHTFVLDDHRADLYLEGSDQHRGWFQSSLLVSTSLGGVAPYKNVVTHGFVVTSKNEKMGKSTGNAVSPNDVLTKYGADTLRLWVALSDYQNDLKIDQSILAQTFEHLKKFRNTLRFCMGNLQNRPVTSVPFNDLPDMEKYVLTKMYSLYETYREHMEAFNYSRAVFSLLEFCNELSNFYFDVRKDSLYCDSANDKRRQSVLYTLEQVFEYLTVMLQPFAPFTVAEAVQMKTGNKQAYLKQFNELPVSEGYSMSNDLLARWSFLKKLRSEFTSQLELKRQQSEIRVSLECDLKLSLPLRWEQGFEQFNLSELLMVSKVETAFLDTESVLVEVMKTNGLKCPRCWNYHHDSNELCTRCHSVEGGL